MEIPTNIIQAVYVCPQQAPVKPSYENPWLWDTNKIGMWCAIFVAAIALLRTYGHLLPITIADLLAYLLLGIAVIFMFMFVIAIAIAIIKLVARSERKVPPKPVFHVGFDSSGVTVQGLSSEDFSGGLARSDIRKVSGYVQDGWFFARDRGVVIERNDGVQFRVALSLAKSRLNQFLNELELSLKQLDYPVVPRRKFLV